MLHTDASGKGLGAVLEQIQDDGNDHPVIFASRTLSEHEVIYGITELETLVVIWALRHFHAYLYGHKCTVYTDHASVKLLLRAKHSSGKLACWCETVAEYDLEVKYLEVKYHLGRKNANADALSRSPLETCTPEGEESDSPTTQVAAVSSDLPEEVPLNVERLQAEDSELGPVFAFVETSPR